MPFNGHPGLPPKASCSAHHHYRPHSPVIYYERGAEDPHKAISSYHLS